MGYLDLDGLQYLWEKLKEKFAVKSHNHDDRYYTGTEINDKLALKVHEETITTAVDLDTMKTTGIYHLKVTGCTNHPYNGNHSTLYVEWSIDAPYQLVIIDSQNRAWRRNYNNSTSTFDSWTELNFTNTWRGIQNNLTSDSTTDSLSAAQGKALKTLVDSKAASNHAHDLSAMINTLSAGTATPKDADYYVSQYVGGGTTTTTYHRRPMSSLWAYIKGKADSVYLKLSGGTLTGQLHIKGTTASKPFQVRGIVGCDPDGVTDGELHLQYGANQPIKLGNTAAYSISADGGTYTGNATTATTASKLSTSAGSATQPIYFKDGVPTATTYALNKTVPADAKFTDTTYSAFKAATSSAAGKTGLVPAPAAGKQAQFLRGDGTWATPPDTNTTYSNMTAATADAAGKAGLVPAPAKGAQAKYLRGDGTWATPTNTTYGAATQSANGLMTAADKKKLDGIATGANAYSLPTATASVLGGVKTGSNITNSSGTLSVSKANVTSALGYTPANSSHTHNYAGSSSAGGTANSVNSFTFKAQTSDPGADSSLTTGQILLVYE